MYKMIVNEIINKAKQSCLERDDAYATSLDILIEILKYLNYITNTENFGEVIDKCEAYRNKTHNQKLSKTKFSEVKESSDFKKIVSDINEVDPSERTSVLMLSAISRLDHEKNYAAKVAYYLLENYSDQMVEMNLIEQGLNAVSGSLGLGNTVDGLANGNIVIAGSRNSKRNPASGENNRAGRRQNQKEERQSALEFFGENLSEKPRRNPLINREKELNRLMEVLLRRDKPNPILVGKQGVGKTAVVHELALRIAEGKNVPIELKDTVKNIYSVEISTLLAGSQYRGEFEAKLKAILEEVKESNRSVILYIDEIHTMMRAGVGSDGALDAANIIKPYLTDGSVRIIGSTTTDEYRKFIEKDKALERRFRAVEIEEPSVDDAIQILDGVKSYYEDFHHVEYTPEAIEQAVKLSDAHIHDKCLPDKAIDLIDEAGAKIAAQKFKEDKTVVVIDVDAIEDVLQKAYKIPKTTVAPDESELIANLESNLSSKIFGQDDACKTILKRIKLAKAGLRDKTKPIANLLFVGPTGTGKTEISKVLAESMNMKLLRFDMSEYQEEHTVAKLFGSPAGYVGYEDGGILTNAVRSSPNCVLLLDEIEKAHPKVYNALLQVMDYGMMTDSKGVKVDFRNAVIIMTSNAGATQIVKKNLGFGGSTQTVNTAAMDEAVKNTFAPEFRARLTDMVKFNDLSEEIAEMIVRKEVNILSDTLSEKNIKLTVTDECVKHIAQTGYTPMTGARNIKNLVSNDISNLLVDDILFGNLKDGGSVKIDWNEEYTKKIRKSNKKS